MNKDKMKEIFDKMPKNMKVDLLEAALSAMVGDLDKQSLSAVIEQKIALDHLFSDVKKDLENVNKSYEIVSKAIEKINHHIDKKSK